MSEDSSLAGVLRASLFPAHLTPETPAVIGATGSYKDMLMNQVPKDNDDSMEEG